jgi:hypothetical protein
VLCSVSRGLLGGGDGMLGGVTSVKGDEFCAEEVLAGGYTRGD